MTTTELADRITALATEFAREARDKGCGPTSVEADLTLAGLGERATERIVSDVWNEEDEPIPADVARDLDEINDHAARKAAGESDEIPNGPEIPY